MKIRLMGSPDLVRAWGKELEREYGISGKEYPNRGGSDIRWYADLDDRTAERVLKAAEGTQTQTGNTEQEKHEKPVRAKPEPQKQTPELTSLYQRLEKLKS